MSRYFPKQIAQWILIAIILMPAAGFAQLLQGQVPNLRAYDKTGINVFETRKDTSAVFNGPTLRIGAGFTQEFQNLKHQNTATKSNSGALYGLAPGFNTAMANLYTVFLLADGIHLNVTVYLSTRRHNEAWVKGGYIQFDKLPFKGEVWDNLMKNVTIKIGHFEVNYGDAHYRRTDGGHTLYNPFIESYIIDGYGTEIGGEVYYQCRKSGLFGMVGLTNGMIKGNVDSAVYTAANGKV